MSVVTVNKYVYGYVARISVSIAFVLTVVFLYQHMKHLYIEIIKKKQLKFNLLFFFSLSLFFWVIVQLILFFIIAFVRFKTIAECHNVMVVTAIVFIMIKLSLYYFLSYKLHTTFKDSNYKFSKKFLIMWCISLIGLNMLSIVQIIQFTKAELDYKKYFYVGCRATFATSHLITIAATDIIGCFVNLYLFGNRLLKITKAMSKSNMMKIEKGVQRMGTRSDETDNNKETDHDLEQARRKEDQFLKVIRKNSILTAFSVVSTVIGSFCIVVFSLPILWYVLCLYT